MDPLLKPEATRYVGQAVSTYADDSVGAGTALVGWSASIAGRVPPLRPGVRLRELGWPDAMRLLRAHRRLALTLLLLGAIGGIVGALTVRRTAVAQTLLMIGDDGGAQTPDLVNPNDRLQNEVALLHSDAVANRLIQQIGVGALFPGLGQPHFFGLPLFGLGASDGAAEQMRQAADLAKQRIAATPLPGGSMLRVAYADPDRATALRALQTVVAAFLQLRINLGGSGAAPSASLAVERDGDKTAAQLREIDGQIQKLRADYRIIDLDQDTAGATARLDDVVKRESQVRERQRAVAGELATASTQLQAAPQRVFDAQETAAHPLDEARATVLALRLERDHMATQYAPTYPALVELERKLASAQQVLQQSSQPHVSATRDVRNPALDVLRNRANDLRIEAAGLEQQLDALAIDYEHALGRVNDLREAETTMHGLQYRRDVLEAVGRQLSVREMSLRVEDSVEKARRARVHVIQAPDLAPTGTDLWPLWLIGGAVGGAAAAALGVAIAARLRRTYVLAREVERDLDLGVLAEFDVDDLAMAEPASQLQITTIAAILADTMIENRPLFSLQSITPDADDDQRDLCLALADQLASQYGLRTLVLDVGYDGIAVPLALEGPGLMPVALAKLAQTSLPLWDPSVEAMGVDAASAAPLTCDPRTGAPLTGAPAGDATAGPLMLPPARHFTERTLAVLQQSCDLLLVVAGGAASAEASRRLAGFVDTTLLVVAAERSPAAMARDLSRGVVAGGGQMLGAVLTGRPQPVLMW